MRKAKNCKYMPSDLYEYALRSQGILYCFKSIGNEYSEKQWSSTVNSYRSIIRECLIILSIENDILFTLLVLRNPYKRFAINLEVFKLIAKSGRFENKFNVFTFSFKKRCKEL